ncbi:serine/threonine protein kinase [Actinoplanes friuliensis]|uniref:serine/threonine protein kinase n=1 Tax=Actinoplanes friuliensis TaxID=196914 RepID=UPI00069455FB|nr:serine/threonine-protein kinase [Actinoplanes friuliensis]
MNGTGLDEPATVDLSGRCVGNSYILICPVGQGATGTVWRGIERTSGEQVAVKLLHEGLLRQPKLVTRFVQERTILMLVKHENIVGVRDLFSAGESLGLVMDFVAGGSLRERLRSDGTLAPGEAARLLAQVAAALAEAHALGVVHRDVKPDNILLQAGDTRADVRLTDFGIARVIDAAGLTTPHSIIGTPHYMAPEVITGGDACAAADVYALGVVLYELVAGRTPYAGEPLAVLRRHLDDEPDRPAGMPDRIWSVIESCLDKDPAGRPAAGDLATVLRDLARILASEPALPPPLDHADETVLTPAVRATPPRAPEGGPARRRRPPNSPRSWVWGRRNGMIVALVAGAALIAGIGGYQAFQQRDAGSVRTDAGPAPAQGLGTGGGAAVLPTPLTSGSAPPAGAAPQSGAGALGAATPTTTRAGGRSAPPRAVAPSAPLVPKPGVTPPAPGKVEGEAEYGPYQCADTNSWSLGHPVLAKPCYAFGDAVRIIGNMEATPGIQVDITMSVRDAGTQAVAAGPYTCKGLMFTDLAMEHVCGPFEVNIPHGDTYYVEESWEYTGRDLIPSGTAKSPEFTW